MGDLLRVFVRKLRQFRKANSGQIAITFAIATIPLVGATGAAIDYSRSSSAKAEMQAALDATALRLIRSAASLNSTDLLSSANSLFKANFNRPTAQNVQVTGSYDSGSGVLNLTASASHATTLMAAIGVHSMDISATSYSSLGGTRPWPVCVMVTDPDSNHTLLVQSASTINFTNCLVQVNTQNWDAVEARDTSYIHSTNGVNCFTGDIHYGDVSPPKQPTCALMPDPYANYKIGTYSTCDYSNYTVKTPGSVLNPGVYCGGLTIQNGATLNPGVYVIKNGDLNVTGKNFNVTATDVTFLLTGKGAGVTINLTNGNIAFSPNTTAAAGQFAGFVFFLDQSISGYLSTSQIVGANVTMSGVVYLTGQQLVLNNKASVTVNPGSIIAGFILPNGGSSLVLNSTATSPTPVQAAMTKSLPSTVPVLLPVQARAGS
jgi:Flp pilus assembly protein TadG